MGKSSTKMQKDFLSHHRDPICGKRTLNIYFPSPNPPPFSKQTSLEPNVTLIQRQWWQGWVWGLREGGGREGNAGQEA